MFDQKILTEAYEMKYDYPYCTSLPMKTVISVYEI